MNKDKHTINHRIEEENSYLRYYCEFEDKKSTWAKESKKEGIKEGKKEGIKEGVYLVAKNAINQGLENEVIATLTGLSIEEVKKINQI